MKPQCFFFTFSTFSCLSTRLSHRYEFRAKVTSTVTSIMHTLSLLFVHHKEHNFSKSFDLVFSFSTKNKWPQIVIINLFQNWQRVFQSSLGRTTHCKSRSRKGLLFIWSISNKFQHSADIITELCVRESVRKRRESAKSEGWHIPKTLENVDLIFFYSIYNFNNRSSLLLLPPPLHEGSQMAVTQQLKEHSFLYYYHYCIHTHHVGKKLCFYSSMRVISAKEIMAYPPRVSLARDDDIYRVCEKRTITWRKWCSIHILQAIQWKKEGLCSMKSTWLGRGNSEEH